MPPQDPYTPTPQPTPVTAAPQPVFVPTGQSPKKRPRTFIVIILAILVLIAAAGYTAYTFLLNSKNEPIANAGPMHVGNYPYVNACNAFTADDFESVVGAKSDRSLINAAFAQETDASSPGRSYKSSCDRSGLDDLSITLIIDQYPDTTLNEEQKLLFKWGDATNDPELGGLTYYISPMLTFQKDNKVVHILVQGYGDRSDSQIQTLAKAAAKKAADKLKGSADLATLSYPSELIGEGYIYQNACSLWSHDDFKKQFGQVDKTFVDMTYAEELIPETQLPSDAARSAHSKCVVGTKEFGGSFAYIDTYYYSTAAKAQAGYDSYRNEAEDITLSGLGDKAVLKAYQASAQQYEKVVVLQGTMMFTVQFVPEDDASRGNSQIQADVKTIAQTVLSRLK